MTNQVSKSRFLAKVLRALVSGDGVDWGFVVLPKEVSAKLPRRGRTSVEGTMNGKSFAATLDPDGKLSHWLRVDSKLLKAVGAKFGDEVEIELSPVTQEPEPEVPVDLKKALAADAEARAAWEATTTIARLDWIHWITTAKQAKTRALRIEKACDMLGSGKSRVCCFDPSGYYSKAFSAPAAAD